MCITEQIARDDSLASEQPSKFNKNHATLFVVIISTIIMLLL